MIKLIQIMTEQQAKLLQLGIRKQKEKTLAEIQEFEMEGSKNLAAAAHDDLKWLHRMDLKLDDLIYSDRI